MTLVIQMLLLAVGFLMLVKGADWFVDGSSAVARRFGIPQLVIGLTIVAMGTSAPEAAVSISAGLAGNSDISLGNIIGSNIFNLLVVWAVTGIWHGAAWNFIVWGLFFAVFLVLEKQF